MAEARKPQLVHYQTEKNQGEGEDVCVCMCVRTTHTARVISFFFLFYSEELKQESKDDDGAEYEESRRNAQIGIEDAGLHFE